MDPRGIRAEHISWNIVRPVGYVFCNCSFMSYIIDEGMKTLKCLEALISGIYIIYSPSSFSLQGFSRNKELVKVGCSPGQCASRWEYRHGRNNSCCCCQTEAGRFAGAHRLKKTEAKWCLDCLGWLGWLAWLSWLPWQATLEAVEGLNSDHKSRTRNFTMKQTSVWGLALGSCLFSLANTFRCRRPSQGS